MTEKNLPQKLIKLDGGAKNWGGGRVWVHAALFHPRTPLVADSTAVAASQSPLAICPVTLHHHRGQRALCLPINGPRSASVSPSPPQTPTIQQEAEMKQKHLGVGYFPAAPPHTSVPPATLSLRPAVGRHHPQPICTCVEYLPRFAGRKSAGARCKLPVPPAVTVHPCNQIMPAEGSGTKACKF